MTPTWTRKMHRSGRVTFGPGLLFSLWGNFFVQVAHMSLQMPPKAASTKPVENGFVLIANQGWLIFLSVLCKRGWRSGRHPLHNQ